ncbi:MAG: hypothetical protein HEEMFOPI_01643 [Holosporales bacterium]
MLKEKIMIAIVSSFFVSSPLKASNEYKFNDFNPNAYNALSGPEEANSILTGIPEAMTYIDRCLDEANDVGMDLGFRLLHRHGFVGQNECMVEHFELRDQRPSLVTTQKTFSSEQYFPASWMIQNGSLKVFEFSTDKKVDKNMKLILENIDVFSDILKTLHKQGLDKVLAPAILKRSSEDFFLIEEGLMLENTRMDPFESVIMKNQEVTIDDPHVIQTVWGHPIKHACWPMAGCYVQFGSGVHIFQVRHA